MNADSGDLMPVVETSFNAAWDASRSSMSVEVCDCGTCEACEYFQPADDPVLSFTEQEADRNVEMGREQQRDEWDRQVRALRLPVPKRETATHDLTDDAWGVELTDQEAADFVQTVMETQPGTVGTLPRPCCHTTGPHHHPACPSFGDDALPDLVDIRPAPLRIVDGQRYADNEGRLYEGDSDGGLWELAAGYVDAGEVEEIDGLHAVKVVPA